LLIALCPALAARAPVAADGPGEPRAVQDDEADFVRRLAELSDRCSTDLDSALELESLLFELTQRPPDEALGGQDLVRAIAWSATKSLNSCLRPEERILAPEACIDLVERSGRADPDPQVRSDTLANAALSRFYLRVGERPAQDYLAVLEAALALEPQPLAARVDLLLQCANLLCGLGRWGLAEERLRLASDALTPSDEQGTPADPRPARLLLEQIRGRIELYGKGRPDVAYTHYHRAAAVAETLGGPERRQHLLEETVFCLSTDDYAGVVERAELLLTDGDLEPALRGEALYRRGLGRWLEARRQGREDAGAQVDLRDALEEGLDSDLSRANCRLALADSAIQSGALDAAIGELAAIEQPILARLERSVHAALHARTLRLGGAARERLAEQRDTLRSCVSEQLAEWGRVAPVPGGVGYLHHAARCEALGELVTLELVLDDGGAGAERALEWLVRAQAQGSTARAMGAGVPTLAEIRALLPEDGVLLAYLFAPHRSHLFVVDRAGIQAHRLEDCWTLRPANRDYSATHFAQPPGGLSAAFREAAFEHVREDGIALRRRLIPDPVLARVLAAERVVLAGEEQLGPLPAEALPVAGGDWLGSAVAVEHWPSIPVAAALAGRERAHPDAREGVLGFVAPAHDTRAFGPALELSDQDLAALESAWPGIALVRGAAATRRALLAADPGAARVSIFYLHGTRDPARALWAGMALAPDAEAGHDGAVWFEDLLRTDASRIVVLAACGAGRGPVRRGEDGSTHLGGVFFVRGARSVVLSPYQVEARSTLRLVEALGEGLGRGLPLAEALRAARAIVAGDPRWREPYYHQLLQLVGWSP
jgi:hypothetical protein